MLQMRSFIPQKRLFDADFRPGSFLSVAWRLEHVGQGSHRQTIEQTSENDNSDDDDDDNVECRSRLSFQCQGELSSQHNFHKSLLATDGDADSDNDDDNDYDYDNYDESGDEYDENYVGPQQ